MEKKWLPEGAIFEEAGEQNPAFHGMPEDVRDPAEQRNAARITPGGVLPIFYQKPVDRRM